MDKHCLCSPLMHPQLSAQPAPSVTHRQHHQCLPQPRLLDLGVLTHPAAWLAVYLITVVPVGQCIQLIIRQPVGEIEEGTVTTQREGEVCVESNVWGVSMQGISTCAAMADMGGGQHTCLASVVSPKRVAHILCNGPGWTTCWYQLN